MNQSLLTFLLACVTSAVIGQEKISVYFESGIYKTTTTSLIGLTNNLKNVVSIDSIVGYCDTVGSANKNILLANRRIQTIISALPDSNLVKAKIAIGENYPILIGKYNAAHWRRVDVFFSTTLKSENTYTFVEKEKTTEFEKNTTIKEITKEMIEMGTIPIIELNIEFYPGTNRLIEGSNVDINDLAFFLNTYPQLNVIIRGHVCCMNDQLLSEARANTIASELLNLGIKKSRFTTIGLSNTAPKISPEITEADKQRNRRVDIVFMKN